MANFAKINLSSDGIAEFVAKNPQIMEKIDVYPISKSIDRYDAGYSVKGDIVRIFLPMAQDTPSVLESISAEFGNKDITATVVIEGFISTKDEFLVKDGKLYKHRKIEYHFDENDHSDYPKLDYNNPIIGEWTNIKYENDKIVNC